MVALILAVIAVLLGLADLAHVGPQVGVLYLLLLGLVAFLLHLTHAPMGGH